MEALAETLTPGTPVYNRSRRGFVAAIERKPGEPRSFMLGSGVMRAVGGSVVVVWDNGTMNPDIPDTMAEDWAAEARRMELPFVADHAEIYAAARQARDDAWKRRQEEQAEAKRRADEYAAEIAPKIPADAKAVIVAEFRRDDSDTMTDYFASVTERTIILAFSSHTRDLFPELRKAARNHPETAHLADAPESAEHREKWSMGAGYYLAAGSYRHDTGWQVRKRSIGGDTPEARAKSVPIGEWSLPEPAKATEAGAVPVGGFTVEKHTHTKRGFDMWIAILPGRVEREEFDRLRNAAEALGGWYSRPWGKTPGGFAFKVEADALAFANAEPSDTPPDGSGPGESAPRVREGMGDKLRALADGMRRDIDSKLGDRRRNTPKQQREADAARIEGTRLQRAQKGLRSLADLHDAGAVPPILAKVTTKAAALELARSHIDRSRAGYYDAGIDTGKPALDTPEAAAFWELIGGGPSEAERQAEELRRKIDSLRFAKIPGYFPTPAAVVARMIEAADIPEGEATILEPSAGSGAILDAVHAAKPGALLYPIERHTTLRDILKGKGYQCHADDFNEYEAEAIFDRVLMNPPFENGQDIEHVRRAFDCLKPGGRLVAIMSPGPFFRQDRKATEFRAWFDELGGERRDLPAGAFKESGTGTATVMVIIDKPEGDPEPVTAPAVDMPKGTRIGTAHFASIAAARSYYAGQGFDAADVLDKLEAGEIHIGPPEGKPGDRIHLDQSEGRFFIEMGGLL